MQLELFLVRRELRLGLLELKRELSGHVAVAGLEMRLDLALELGRVRLAVRHLARDGLDKTAVHLESLASFLETLGRLIHLELHDGDRIGLEEEVRDLVEPRAERAKEFPENHGFGVSVSPASIASARILPR